MLIDYVETLGKLSGVSDLMDAEVIVSNIVDSTVSVAVKMHLGYMDSTALKERTIYQSVFSYCFIYCILMYGMGNIKAARAAFLYFLRTFIGLKNV